jgi:hypothetical protein
MGWSQVLRVAGFVDRILADQRNNLVRVEFGSSREEQVVLDSNPVNAGQANMSWIADIWRLRAAKS